MLHLLPLAQVYETNNLTGGETETHGVVIHVLIFWLLLFPFSNLCYLSCQEKSSLLANENGCKGAIYNIYSTQILVPHLPGTGSKFRFR